MAYPHFTSEEIQSEDWRAILDYEGWYKVSSLGRVRRIKGGRGTTEGAFLTPNFSGPYGRIRLYRGSAASGKIVFVHRIVALAFLGEPCPPRHFVNHLSGDRHDNRVTNLEWVTPAENVRHGLRLKGAFGSPNEKGEMREADVVKMRHLAAGGLTVEEIGARFNCDYTTVALIVAGLSYAHCGGPVRERKERRRFSPDEKAAIYAMFQQGASGGDIARTFGLNHAVACGILRRLRDS